MCVYVLEEGWGRGGAYKLDGDGGGGAGGLGFHVMGSRCQDGQVALVLLAGRDLTLTASQPELSDEV